MLTMLQVERELALAQAKHGLISKEAASAIAKACRAGKINIDLVIRDGGKGGNLIIPLLNQLISLIDQESKDSSRFVHFGATSQDIIDTTLMVQLKETTKILLAELDGLLGALKQISLDHKRTIMAGRSFLQHARPISFGLKVAGWLDPLLRSREALRSLFEESFALQLGGAAGTLSNMQENGEAIASTMCEALGLSPTIKPWHTQRDRLARIASAFGILAGNLGKIARDISLLSQTEVGEVRESGEKGRGGSSTMPQKTNPVASIAILANVQRIPALVAVMISSLVQDHERSTGPWHAEWETLPEIAQLTAGTLERAVELIHGLEIDKERMIQNLEMTKGLIYSENISLALIPLIGRKQALELVKECCVKAQSSNFHLSEVCLSHPIISKYINKEDMKQLFDPQLSIGLSEKFIDNVLKNIS